MARRYWLMKSEPSVYSIRDLQKDGTTEWWGIRNYKARNYMRDEMRIGDGILFYHSNTDVIGVYGLAAVAAEAHPDSKQFEKGHRYHDPDTDRDQPRWWCVDIRHLETFDRPVTRDRLKETPGLEGMAVLRKGSRLSITPVTEKEFEIVRRLAR
ncbi:MAG TPA: EVE domain-containing protein [Candidatus Polarisedimenticolia bacterium]|nr:EVE domain-containing protein [Candidatus Polarisedimenticolia bacterium]